MSVEVDNTEIVINNNETNDIENISEPTEEFLENSSFNYWNMDGSEYSFNIKTGEIFMKVNDEWVLNCKTVQPTEVDMSSIQMNNFLLGQHINCLYQEITRLYNMEINPLKSALNHANWTIRNFIRDRNNGNYSSLMNTINKYKSLNSELREENNQLKSKKHTKNELINLQHQISSKDNDLILKQKEFDSLKQLFENTIIEKESKLKEEKNKYDSLKLSFDNTIIEKDNIISDLHNKLSDFNQSKLLEINCLNSKNNELLNQIRNLNEELELTKSNV